MIKTITGTNRDEVHKSTSRWIVEKGNSIKETFVTESTIGRFDYRTRQVTGDVEYTITIFYEPAL